MENDVILSCAGIRKSYTYVPVHSLLQDRVLRWPTVRRERRTLRVLCGIDIAVCRGEWVGITGPNGGGKTTLLSILAGLLPADEGSVERRGELSCFFGLGMGFHGERNAAENVAIHSLLNGIRRRDIGELTERIVAFAGLAAHRDLPLKCYSAGMRVRLGFAAAMHIDADCYILDEIIAVGDVAFKKQCVAHLLSMKAAGKSALLVSHTPEHLDALCDRSFVLRDGVLHPRTVAPRACPERAETIGVPSPHSSRCPPVGSAR